ncbi:MAG: barstar family protein [Acidimicrobiales bacterium]
MTQPDSGARRRLLPEGIDQVQIYHRQDVLRNDIERCRAEAWEAIEFDASGWGDGEQLHDDLTRKLNLPTYYGRNLDALADVSRQLPFGETGFTAEAAGGLLVFHHYDGFMAAKKGRATAVLDIFVTASNWSLQHGWPLACLVQSDDPQLVIGPVAATVIAWNRAERTPASRGL